MHIVELRNPGAESLFIAVKETDSVRNILPDECDVIITGGKVISDINQTFEAIGLPKVIIAHIPTEKSLWVSYQENPLIEVYIKDIINCEGLYREIAKIISVSYGYFTLSVGDVYLSQLSLSVDGFCGKTISVTHMPLGVLFLQNANK